MSDYPNVAFLTMAYDPIATMRAIIGAVEQSYPGARTIYLLQQRPFPAKMVPHLDVKIKQFDVNGKWPALWYFKLMKFFEKCTEDYFVWWDEDDRFEGSYVESALEPALSGSFGLAWNRNMIMVRGSSIEPGRYRSPIGTLAGRVDVAKSVTRLINPGGNNAKDRQYRKKLEKSLTIGEHTGLRYYIHHKNSHTTRYTKTGRAQGEDVDA